MTEESKELTAEEISFYYDEMVRSGLLELEVETPAGKITLRRAQKSADAQLDPRLLFRRKSDYTLERPESAPVAAAALPPAPGQTINSPITGMLYRSSSPQAQPFVKVGDSVEAGTTLCIVEAMKVMNEIKAETACKIVKILGENGKPVTKGQSMFQIQTL